MMSLSNSISQQPQGHESDRSFQLAVASSSTKNSVTIRDGSKPTIKPIIQQQQQQQQNKNQMQGIVFANTIQLQQPQIQAKLQRQSLQDTSNTRSLTTRTIQRTHRIQLNQASTATIVQGEK